MSKQPQRRSVRLSEANKSKKEALSSAKSSRAPTKSAKKAPKHGPPPKKRQRRTCTSTQPADAQVASESSGTVKKARTRKTKISNFANMPLDIMYEIFAFCHPHDLLRLSRASKCLRNTLMDRNIAWIWRACLSHIDDLPARPEGMSEPEYTHILFDDSCSFCLRRKVDKRICVTLQKACKKCFAVQFPEDFIIEERYRRTELISKLGIRETYEILPSIWDTNDDNSEQRFSLEYLLKYEEEYKVVVALGDDAVDVWYDEKEARLIQLEEESEPFADWWDQQDAKRLHERALEREELMKQRGYYVIDKLRRSGWDDEIGRMEDMSAIMNHKLIMKGPKLMDDLWPKIKDEMDDFMRRLRDKRIKDEEDIRIGERFDIAAQAYDAYIRDQSIDAIVPRIEDVIAMPCIRQLVEGPADFQPRDVIATLEEFDALKKWRNDCDAALVKLISQALDTTASKVNLALATTQFCVKIPGYVREILSYPEVLDPYKVACGETSYGTAVVMDPWTTKYLSFEPKINERARDLIELAGLDPDKATTRDMDEKDPWFERKAGLENGERTLMRWRDAIAATRYQVANLVLVSEEVAAKAREKAEHTEWRPDLNDCRMARCKHCKTCLTPNNGTIPIYLHLQDQHGITAPAAADFELDAFGPRPDGIALRRSDAAS